jgi:hypothetical protein
MNFRYPSDAIVPLDRFYHHVGHDGHSLPVWASRDFLPHAMSVSGDDGTGAHSRFSFAAPEAHSPSEILSRQDAAPADSGNVNHVTPSGGIESGPAPSNPSPGSGSIQTGGNTAGDGGDGHFYGGIVHASMLIYEPINISVAVGYGSVALAQQTNDVSVDQSAFQMAGVGGSGGNSNIASGGSVSASPGFDVISTGGNGAGNGGSGYFSGALVDAPIVIYHPVNIAVAGSGGTAHANQSNTVEIDQSAVQIAGVGGNGGNGNVSAGGSIITLDPGWGSSNGGSAWDLHTGGSQAGNGGDGSSDGSLVHTSFVLYDPINIAVAGYNSSAYAVQTNSVYVDQSALQLAGIGGYGGNGNVAMGGSASLASHGSWGGSDAIATGANSAGNGGSGHFSGSLIDVSIAIYAPINIAIAGPNSTAEADQINNVHIDQSAVQIAGVGGDGGHGNLALGGDLATHLLSDLHLVT